MASEQEASRASELARPRACFPALRLHGQRRNFLDAATISMGIMGICQYRTLLAKSCESASKGTAHICSETYSKQAQSGFYNPHHQR